MDEEISLIKNKIKLKFEKMARVKLKFGLKCNWSVYIYKMSEEVGYAASKSL